MARDFEVSKAAIDTDGQQHAAQNTEHLMLPGGVAPFEAQYERVGQDLILSDHGAPVFTVTDYFLTATPADLVAANGAVLPSALAARLSGSSLDAQYAQSGDVAASEPIGQVEAVSGLATVQHNDGSIEELTIGLKIYQNDILSTTINGKTSVTFSDGTIFSLAQSSRMVIDTLIFDPDGSENAGSFTLLTGGFVFIAGQVAKTGDMDVNTPTATLGIRGTTVQVDIQMVDGVATLNVTLNRDFDGQIGMIEMTDLDGNLIATVTSTDKEWVISPVEGQTREVVRTASDMANDNELLADAFSAVQSAMLRVEAGEALVEQGSGEEAAAPPTPETVDPVPTPEVDGTGQGGDPLVPPSELPPAERDNNDAPPPGAGPEKEASILDDGAAPFILPPTAADVEVAGIEDPPDGFPISGLVTATGGDPNAMVFFIATDPSNGTVAMNADGTFSYVPDANFAGTDVFTYTVIQGSGSNAASDIGQITVSVSAVNDDPVAQDAVFTVNEDSSVTGTLSAFDVDDDAITFSVLEGQGPDNGTVAMQPDGAFAYVPDGDFNGAGSFTYTVTDNAGATDTATVSLTVSAVNDAPVVDALVANTTSEDDAAFNINMLAGASDVDAGETATLGVQNVTGLVDGVTLSGPTLTVDPADTAFQYLGVDDSEVITVDYEIVDVQGAPVAQSATITITGSNDAPVVTSNAVAAADAVTESGKDANGVVVDAGDPDASGTLTSSDVDTGATAAWSGDTTGIYGSFAIDAVTGVWTYTLDNTDGDTDALAAGAIVTDTFTATVTDDEGATATQLVTVTITGSNDAPILAVTDLAATEDGASVSGTPTFTDADTTDTHSYSVTAMATGQGSVAINAGTGVYTYSPGSDFQSLATGETTTVSFDVTIADDNGGSDIETVNITVTGTNDAPVAVDDTITAGRILFVSDSGVGSDIATVLTNAGHEVDVVLDNFTNGSTLALTGDLSGYSAIYWSASGDAYGNYHTDTAMFANLESFASNGGSVFVTGYDSIASPTDSQLISFLGGTSSQDFGVPSTGTMGANSLTTGVIDIQGVQPTGYYGDTDTLYVDSGAGTQIVVGSSYGGTGASWSLRSMGTGEIAYVSNGIYGTTGSEDGWTDTSAGGNGAYNAALLNFAFAAQASSGVLENSIVSIDTATLLANDTDVDQTDVINVSNDNGTSTVVLSGNTITYDPNGEFDYLSEGETAQDTFSYTVSDGNGGSDTETVSFTVDGVNDAPIVNDTRIIVSENTVFNGTATATDVDDVALTFSAVEDQASANGAVVMQPDGTFGFTPDVNYNGASSFNYTVTDSAGAAETATVSVVFMASTAQILTGTDGADLLLGSDLADTISGEAGADEIFGFGGDDMISFSGSAAVGLDGGAGRDVLSLLFSGAVDLQSLNATSVEAVDLNNDTAQNLEMSLEDLNSIFDTGDIDLNAVLDANAPSLSYVPASTLTVLGDSSDSVTISGLNEGQAIQDTLIDVTATTGETLSIWQITTIGSNDVLATLGIDTDIAVNGGQGLS